MGGPECTQSFSTTLDLGVQFLFEEAASVVVLDIGAAANLACFRLLAHRNRILEREGFLRVPTYPAGARFKFGDGRLGEVRHAADSQWELRECSRLICQRFRVKVLWEHWAAAGFLSRYFDSSEAGC